MFVHLIYWIRGERWVEENIQISAFWSKQKTKVWGKTDL